jgi:benzodiazapine receptor
VQQGKGLLQQEVSAAAAHLQVSPLAALLFAPTQVWVTIAAKLNYDIVRLNADRKNE